MTLDLFFSVWNWKYFLQTIATKYENNCWNHFSTTYSIGFFGNIGNLILTTIKFAYLAILKLTSILIIHIFWQKKNLLSQSIPSDIKKYHELCTMVSLKHLIEVPARVTVSSSTIIDHILASFPNIYWQVSQQGVIDVELSDHQLIYFIIKKSVHKQIRWRSLKNYSSHFYEDALARLDI